jgi:hypothetical protein
MNHNKRTESVVISNVGVDNPGYNGTVVNLTEMGEINKNIHKEEINDDDAEKVDIKDDKFGNFILENRKKALDAIQNVKLKLIYIFFV